MAADTQAINKDMDHFDDHEAMWLFGYGSLIYKVDFPFLDSRPATLRHWERRFWQGSHDHRGTPQAPGRVVTLVEQKDALCHGMAFRISPDTLAQLDHREKNGYLRVLVQLGFEDGSTAEGLVYIATAENAAWLGPASERSIASHIAKSSGPSGHNRDYVLALAQSLRELSAYDPHVFAIEELLCATKS